MSPMLSSSKVTLGDMGEGTLMIMYVWVVRTGCWDMGDIGDIGDMVDFREYPPCPPIQGGHWGTWGHGGLS